MYRSRAEVDKHVAGLKAKLSDKEFKTRAYSLGRLYYEIGDYENCRHYVGMYLKVKDNSAAAHKLLGDALQKMGSKERALEEYKTSLDIDPSQKSLILKICELLVDDEVSIDTGRAQYWCERAESSYPSHPTTFHLREKLIASTNNDPETVIKFLQSEISTRPNDASLHTRLVQQYLQSNNKQEAFKHALKMEFLDVECLRENYQWYETLSTLLSPYDQVSNYQESDYQLLVLTMLERLCTLSWSIRADRECKSIVECSTLMYEYDSAIKRVAEACSNTNGSAGKTDFRMELLRHHRGQFCLHAATLLLKKAKKDQLNWRDAVKVSAPFLLFAFHIAPTDTNTLCQTLNEIEKLAVKRWYQEGSYRCSQAGHMLLTNIREKKQLFLERVSQYCSGTHWRDKLCEKLFSGKVSSTYFVNAPAFDTVTLRLPRFTDVQEYDLMAQRMYPESLHHMVWLILNYKNYATFKCILFDLSLNEAARNISNCGPETLSKLDVDAFLYCAAFASQNQSDNDIQLQSRMYHDKKEPLLPANIMESLCRSNHCKWWECAYKFSQKNTGADFSEIRVALSRGIETVRCVGNHGLDPKLLCTLAKIFSERAEVSKDANQKGLLEARAALYYTAAIPLLEKLKTKVPLRMPEKRMFNTTSDMSPKEITALIEDGKLYLGLQFMNDGENEKAVDILTGNKSPQASYNLSLIYKKMADEAIDVTHEDLTSEVRSKHVILLTKAKTWACLTLERLKKLQENIKNPLFSLTNELIESIDSQMSRIDRDGSIGNNGDYDDKLSSEDGSSNGSIGDRIHTNFTLTNNSLYPNLSSTPKHRSIQVHTPFRSVVDSNIYENTRSENRRQLEKIEAQIKQLQKKDSAMNTFVENFKCWVEDNGNLMNEVRDIKNKLPDQIITGINLTIQDTIDQFKMLKLSVDQVKDKIGEYRNECKTDVGDLRKEVAELKKEISKLKNASSEPTIDENEFYNIDDVEEYQTNDNAQTFPTPLQYSAPTVLPNFRPPVPLPHGTYPLFSHSNPLYTLINQYSQLAQPLNVPPLFETQNRPGIQDLRQYAPPVGLFPPTEQPLYPDIQQLWPTGLASSTTTSTLPSVSRTVPPAAPIVQPVVQPEVPKSLPVNVVITSSDPLPSRTTAPQPTLSVTIPPEHIKGSPHNYQIQMPPTKPHVPSTLFNPNVTPAFGPSPVAKPAPSFAGTESVGAFLPVQLSEFDKPKVTNETPKPVSIFGTPTSGANLSYISIASTPNVSMNKSRTLSEKSNTSVENYDPCPDFKPIIPLPDEVEVKTGEENETSIFSARAKLYRFVDKQWKERGLGTMKLLQNNASGKVRVLMRREQVHKICANHIITHDMTIEPMKNEDKAYFWVAMDYADEKMVLEKFSARFKTAEIAIQFYETFEKARVEAKATDASPKKVEVKVSKEKENIKQGFGDKFKPAVGSWSCSTCYINNDSSRDVCVACQTPKVSLNKSTTEPKIISNSEKQVVGGFTFNSTPTFKVIKDTEPAVTPTTSAAARPFAGFVFKPQVTMESFTNIFSKTTATLSNTISETPKSSPLSQARNTDTILTNTSMTSDHVEEFVPTAEFAPVIPLPELVEVKTGEENETVLFEHRSKLLRFDSDAKEWKERGLGIMKLLVQKNNDQKLRLLMRREQILKVCCNHFITKNMTFNFMPNMNNAVTWLAQDFAEGTPSNEAFCLRFKTAALCQSFKTAVEAAQAKLKDGDVKVAEDTKAQKEVKNANQQSSEVGFGDKFKPKPGSWNCSACYTNNIASAIKCIACEGPAPGAEVKTSSVATTPQKQVLESQGWGDKFKLSGGNWECKSCYIHNDSSRDYCIACNNPKDPTAPNKDQSSMLSTPTKFTFGIPANVNVSSPQSADKPKLPAPSALIFDPKTGSATSFKFGIQPAISKTEATPSAFDIAALSLMKKDEKAADKPFLFETPAKANISESFASKENGKFEFVMKPKGPGKGKSPLKSPGTGHGDSGNEYASEDDGDHIHFTPVIPLPEEVNVTTGEEDEEVLYQHRAKLYRFMDKNWKERGVGDVKILQHKDTKKVRVLMRREQVLKICLNHVLTPDIEYIAKDDSTWLFSANDFTEGEINLERFCIRFKNKEIATNFKNAINAARAYVAGDQKTGGGASDDGDSDDVVYVNKIEANEEDKEKARSLMLPENFYNYKNMDDCKGCRGCKDEEEVEKEKEKKPSFVPSTPLNVAKFAIGKSENIFTPDNNASFMSTVTQGFASPFNTSSMESVYGTPKLEVTATTQNSWWHPATDMSVTSTTAKDSHDLVLNTAPKTLFGSPIPISVFETDSSLLATPKADDSKKTLLKPPKLTTASSPSSDSSTVNVIKDDIIPKPVADLIPKTDSFFSNMTFGAVGQKPSPWGPVVNTTATTQSNIFSGIGKTDSLSALVPQPETKISSSFETKSLFSGEPSSANIFAMKSAEFGSSIFGMKPVFGPLDSSKTQAGGTSIFGGTLAGEIKTTSIFGGTPAGDTKTTSVFGGMPVGDTNTTSMFGGTPASDIKTTSIFGADSKANSVFGVDSKASSIFGTNANETKPSTMFGSPSVFGVKPIGPETTGGGNIFSGSGNVGSLFSSSKPVFGQSLFGDVKSNGETNGKTPNLFTIAAQGENLFAAVSESAPSFAELNTNAKENSNFKWAGTGQQVFSAAKKESRDKKNVSQENAGGEGDHSGDAGADEEYDPHYEPIIAMPDEIVVTTGEENETKLFCERAKLYRYDDDTREWKERGVGEMKLLHDEQRNTYRLLMRREQVHKVVLNQLVGANLTLLPMKNSVQAWTWIGMNYAEATSGAAEKLAVRFKNVDLSNRFKAAVDDAVQKLQLAPAPQPATAQVIPQVQEEVVVSSTDQSDDQQDEDYAQDEEDDDEGNEDYEENMCDMIADVWYYPPDGESVHEGARVQITYDVDYLGVKILVVDQNTGELYTEMIITTGTVMECNGRDCTWFGRDTALAEQVDRQVTARFQSEEDAATFHEHYKEGLMCADYSQIHEGNED